jgi:flavin-dependent dehydrogenase
VTPSRFDVVVVGAGPAGSVAALVLARGGARVALVDKAVFPRDKACGDLIGPRGVQVLHDLGIELPAGRVGDMDVVGPTGRRVRLRATAGLTYPGYALVLPRRQLDDLLRRSALAAGAIGLSGRAERPLFASGPGAHLAGFALDGGEDDGAEICADVVLGADGALSRVAEAAGLVDARRVLWGFALRAYVAMSPALPEIHFWEPRPMVGYPGYGWLFPGVGGAANIGLRRTSGSASAPGATGGGRRGRPVTSTRSSPPSAPGPSPAAGSAAG